MSNAEKNTIKTKKDVKKNIDGSTPKKRRSRKKKITINDDGTVNATASPTFYFTNNTENAIVNYVNEDDLCKKNKIYNDELKYPLNKLAENIINTFKFPYYNESYKDTKHEVVSFLICNLDKYQIDKGKAFSYFSTIAKNYLININNNNYKKFKAEVSISEPDSSIAGGSSSETSTTGGISTVNNNVTSEKNVNLEDKNIAIQDLSNDLKEFITELIEYYEINIPKMFNKQRDINIAYEILNLCRNYDTIENFNKKSLYLLMRELSGYSTINITNVINKMKESYKKLKLTFDNNGTIFKD